VLATFFLVPTVYTESFLVLVGCFAVATFAYAAFSTVILNLPADIYPTGSVASVSGLGGTAAGAGTIAAIYLTGWVSDRWARGSYSAARPGFAHCRKVLARPVGERVFFAGDACTVDTFGAIHGAWASGVAAAGRVIGALAPRPVAPAAPVGRSR